MIVGYKYPAVFKKYFWQKRVISVEQKAETSQTMN